MVQALRGMKDILPPESDKWKRLNNIASEVFSSFGYSLIMTPIVEKTELFVRSVGQDSDVVSKEMYTFNDRGDEPVTLRPEGTASVMRAYLDSQWKGKLLKTWYWGPMFRYERPQKGRYRQFYQFGVEAICTDSAYIDAELIYMLDFFYKKLGIRDLSLELNSIGCEDCRPSYRDKLVSFFNLNKGELCSDCIRRLEANPLRVLDCKKQSCIALATKSPLMKDHLCGSCSDHHRQLKTLLDSLGLGYNENHFLVRGLDYYTKTVFEFTSKTLGGRQNALGGGGRYDSLSSQLGEKAVPSVGYAGGVERTISMMPDSDDKNSVGLYLAFMDKPTMDKYLSFVFDLKSALSEVKCGKDFSFIDDDFKVRDIKKHLSRADKLGAKFAIIAGQNELSKSSVILKNLLKKQEFDISINLDNTKSAIAEILRRIIE